jgi:hypothetical protein
MNYEGKFGTVDPKENNKDLLENLFLESETPDLVDTDETLSTPLLVIDLNEVDRKTSERAKKIVERLSDYYFDERYIKDHPYIKNKIAQEVDNIRRLLKMLTVNEKAQDSLIKSITINAGKGTLYGSLTSLQNSMLQMQSQLNQLTANLENIFKEMQANCEETFEEKAKEQENEDGSKVVLGSRDFIKEIDEMINSTKTSEAINSIIEKNGTNN